MARLPGIFFVVAMLPIYLPVAKISVDIFAIVLVGFANGLFMGVFGVSGAFFAIPGMVNLGIPTGFAVVTASTQTIASSFLGFLHNCKNNNVDFAIGSFICLGLLLGVGIGSHIFAFLNARGLLSIAIPMIYVCVFGVMGVLMFSEGFLAVRAKRLGIVKPVRKQSNFLNFTDYLPLKIYSPRSDARISLLLPLLVGIVAALALAIAGVSTSFLMIPVMIYVMRLPTLVSLGTSFYTSVIVSIIIAVAQAVRAHNVDIVLSLIMTGGAIIGGRIGVKISAKIPPEELRAFLGIIMLMVVFILLFNLCGRPDDLYGVFSL